MRRNAWFYHPLGKLHLLPLMLWEYNCIHQLAHARPKHGQVPLMAELPSPLSIRPQREGASGMEKVRKWIMVAVL